MNDSYAECLVKRKTPPYAIPLKIILSFICAIAVFLALTTMFGIILLFAAVAAAYFSFRNLNLEYEYLYVSNQLSIDKIMGRAKRKKVWEGSIEEIQIIAPSDSYLLNDYQTTNTKTVDYSSATPNTKTYSIMTQSGGNSTKVIFEPNEKMLRCMRQTAPRKVVL